MVIVAQALSTSQLHPRLLSLRHHNHRLYTLLIEEAGSTEKPWIVITITMRSLHDDFPHYQNLFVDEDEADDLLEDAPPAQDSPHVRSGRVAREQRWQDAQQTRDVLIRTKVQSSPTIHVPGQQDRSESYNDGFCLPIFRYPVQ